MPGSHGATGTLDGIGQRDHAVTSEYRIFGPPGTERRPTWLGRFNAPSISMAPPASW